MPDFSCYYHCYTVVDHYCYYYHFIIILFYQGPVDNSVLTLNNCINMKYYFYIDYYCPLRYRSVFVPFLSLLELVLSRDVNWTSEASFFPSCTGISRRQRTWNQSYWERGKSRRAAGPGSVSIHGVGSFNCDLLQLISSFPSP